MGEGRGHSRAGRPPRRRPRRPQGESLALALHVRGCPGCDGFVDELAALRRWLAVRGVGRPGVSAVDDQVLVQRARGAVVRELEARLARDLLARITGRGSRRAAEIAADLRRCELLRLASRWDDEVWSRVCAGLRGHGRPRAGDPRGLLGLAACLDPTGLDLTLAWVASLSREGQEERAQAEAQRYLSLMEGLVHEGGAGEDEW